MTTYLFRTQSSSQFWCNTLPSALFHCQRRSWQGQEETAAALRSLELWVSSLLFPWPHRFKVSEGTLCDLESRVTSSDLKCTSAGFLQLEPELPHGRHLPRPIRRGQGDPRPPERGEASQDYQGLWVSVFLFWCTSIFTIYSRSEKTPTSAFTLKNLLYNILTKLSTAIKTLFANQTDHCHRFKRMCQ